jgi:hypothetical protein
MKFRVRDHEKSMPQSCALMTHHSIVSNQSENGGCIQIGKNFQNNEKFN